MDWKLKGVAVPVSGTDQTTAFYRERLRFCVGHDTTINPGNRIGQLTPGCAGSVVVGEDVVPHMPPGFLQDLQPVVPDGNSWAVQQISRQV